MPVLLNRLLRPLRHPRLDLLGFGEWDGDPNERFNLPDSQRWLARFDEDSDWPSAAQRQPGSAAPHSEPPRTHVAAGEACPRAGYWFTRAKHGSRRHFEQGELFPAIPSETTVGLTLWEWAPDQTSTTEA
ncbi:hypothetical protein P4056_08850 [Pseudomonas aeruginosa]|nr:hypothetical protein [Pseudomonas aeruginosa]